MFHVGVQQGDAKSSPADAFNKAVVSVLNVDFSADIPGTLILEFSPIITENIRSRARAYEMGNNGMSHCGSKLITQGSHD